MIYLAGVVLVLVFAAGWRIGYARGYDAGTGDAARRISGFVRSKTLK